VAKKKSATRFNPLTFKIHPRYCVGLMALTLLGCGGKGDDPLSSMGTATPASISVSGTVSQGNPLSNATVSYIDSTGQNTGEVTAAQDGTFQLPVKGVAPFHLTAVSRDKTKTYRSLIFSPESSSVTQNINPVTDLLTQAVEKNAGAPAQPSSSNFTRVSNKIHTNQIRAIEKLINAVILPLAVEIAKTDANLLSLLNNSNGSVIGLVELLMHQNLTGVQHIGLDDLLDKVQITIAPDGTVTITAGGASTASSGSSSSSSSGGAVSTSSSSSSGGTQACFLNMGANECVTIGWSSSGAATSSSSSIACPT